MYASVQSLDVEAAAPAAEKSSSRRRRGVLVWGLAAAAWCVAGVGFYRVAAWRRRPSDLLLFDDFDGVDYYRVRLPVRPNGSFGWIRKTDVDLFRHNFAILVDLDAFTMTIFKHEQVVMETTVGVARDNAPTPLGRYYTTEILQPREPDTVYGVYAYGLSGFSDTFVTFNGGPGQLGIHGTNDPDTLGSNVSSGCVRMHNDDVTRMVETLQVTAGVPVEVMRSRASTGARGLGLRREEEEVGYF